MLRWFRPQNQKEVITLYLWFAIIIGIIWTIILIISEKYNLGLAYGYLMINLMGIPVMVEKWYITLIEKERIKIRIKKISYWGTIMIIVGITIIMGIKSLGEIKEMSLLMEINTTGKMPIIAKNKIYNQELELYKGHNPRNWDLLHMPNTRGQPGECYQQIHMMKECYGKNWDGKKYYFPLHLHDIKIKDVADGFFYDPITGKFTTVQFKIKSNGTFGKNEIDNLLIRYKETEIIFLSVNEPYLQNGYSGYTNINDLMLIEEKVFITGNKEVLNPKITLEEWEDMTKKALSNEEVNKAVAKFIEEIKRTNFINNNLSKE